eukprot:superscaffoldBa00005902_g20920
MSDPQASVETMSDPQASVETMSDPQVSVETISDPQVSPWRRRRTLRRPRRDATVDGSSSFAEVRGQPAAKVAAMFKVNTELMESVEQQRNPRCMLGCPEDAALLRSEVSFLISVEKCLRRRERRERTRRTEEPGGTCV